VDVASGVESSPGVKDPERMRRFIHEARAAAGARLTKRE
jgi:phosphoribosylanthranilate isomerase